MSTLTTGGPSTLACWVKKTGLFLNPWVSDSPTGSLPFAFSLTHSPCPLCLQYKESGVKCARQRARAKAPGGNRFACLRIRKAEAVTAGSGRAKGRVVRVRGAGLSVHVPKDAVWHRPGTSLLGSEQVLFQTRTVSAGLLVQNSLVRD